MQGQLYIEQMYAFVVVDEDGTEGIPAFMGPDQLLYPMVAADWARVEDLMPIAQSVAESGKEVTLVRFSERTVIQIVQPEGAGETISRGSRE